MKDSDQDEKIDNVNRQQGKSGKGFNLPGLISNEIVSSDLESPISEIYFPIVTKTPTDEDLPDNAVVPTIEVDTIDVSPETPSSGENFLYDWFEGSSTDNQEGGSKYSLKKEADIEKSPDFLDDWFQEDRSVRLREEEVEKHDIRVCDQPWALDLPTLSGVPDLDVQNKVHIEKPKYSPAAKQDDIEFETVVNIVDKITNLNNENLSGSQHIDKKLKSDGFFKSIEITQPVEYPVENTDMGRKNLKTSEIFFSREVDFQVRFLSIL